MRPLLILQHEEDCPPGLVGEYLRDAGLPVDLRRLEAGDAVPEPGELDGYAAVVSLGGEMNVGEEDRFPFLSDERRLLAAALEGEVPTLGLCLGAQQMAAAAGGGVERRDEIEVGWYPIGTAQPDDLLVGILPSDRVFHWRWYFCRLPQDAVVVAVRGSEPQVFRWGSHAWGVQFHPEVDKRTVLRWIDDDRETVEHAWPGGVKRLRAASKRELYRSALTCGLLTANFLAASGARVRARGG